jgi:hypothetical protein
MSNPIITDTKKVIDENAKELAWIRHKYEQKKGLLELERPEMIPDSSFFAFKSSPPKTQQIAPYELRPSSSFREISGIGNSNNKMQNYNLQEGNLTTLFGNNNTFTQTVTKPSINSLVYSEMNSSIPNFLKNVNDSLDLAKKRNRNKSTTKKTKTKNKIYNPNYYKLFKNAFDEQEKSSNKTSSLLSFSSEF